GLVAGVEHVTLALDIGLGAEVGGELDVALQRHDRGAQFMVDAGDELVLEAVELFLALVGDLGADKLALNATVAPGGGDDEDAEGELRGDGDGEDDGAVACCQGALEVGGVRRKKHQEDGEGGAGQSDEGNTARPAEEASDGDG